MRLAHLDQKIRLHWGEAEQLAAAIEWVLCGQLELEQPARPVARMMLCFGPLYRARGRLLGRALAERHHQGPRSRKPWQLTLRYDEIAALHYILPFAPLAGQAWDEIHRAKLNLEHLIDFSR